MAMNIIDQLMFNLKTLSTVPRGRRINTNKEFIYLEDESSLQGVNRWLDGSSRDKMATFIVKEVRTLIEISKWICESIYLSSSSKLFCEESRQERIQLLTNIQRVLEGTLVGIDNLCTTYDDVNVIAKLRPTCDEATKQIQYIALIIQSRDDVL